MKLPELFDLIFKNKERQFDKQRWALLEWILDLDEGFVKPLTDKNKSHFSAVVLTLQYLVQVIFYGQLNVFFNYSLFF